MTSQIDKKKGRKVEKSRRKPVVPTEVMRPELKGNKCSATCEGRLFIGLHDSIMSG